jgi:nitrile hydratase beta subunit-like protein
MAGGLEPGDRVRVRDDYPMGHIRTPVYVRGKEGVITRDFGPQPNPEVLALGRDGLPKKTLYEVRFKQSELWPDYNGPETDTVLIDIYEHWLSRI